MEIREMLRQLRRGRSNRAVARALSIDRKTVATYRNWAQEQGLLEGPLLPLGDLHRLLEETMQSPAPPQNVSSVAPYEVLVKNLRREGCRERATQIGPATRRVVDILLDHRPEDRLRTAGRVLKLGEQFGSRRLEAACTRALRFDDPAYTTIKRILQQGLEAEELPATAPAPPASIFARAAADLVGHLLGAASWK